MHPEVLTWSSNTQVWKYFKIHMHWLYFHELLHIWGHRSGISRIFPNVVKQASRQEIRILQNLASISSGGARVYFVLNYYSATYLDRYLTL